jgi:hypothetical protein
MTSTITSIDPSELLNAVFEIDQLAAVRIANIWGEASSTPEQTDAAWDIVQRQTVLSVCIDCRWPVVEDDPHHSCIRRLLSLTDDEEDGRWGQCMRCKGNLTESEVALNDICESCRPVVYAEWVSNQERLVEEAAERRMYPEESDDDDGCPHCGSHTCNTWDCQQ